MYTHQMLIPPDHPCGISVNVFGYTAEDVGAAIAKITAVTTSWQPIETAPKGLVILYWPASKPAQGHPSNTLAPMIRVDHVGSTPNRRPSHWMPLPAPPA